MLVGRRLPRCSTLIARRCEVAAGGSISSVQPRRGRGGCGRRHGMLLLRVSRDRRGNGRRGKPKGGFAGRRVNWRVTVEPRETIPFRCPSPFRAAELESGQSTSFHCLSLAYGCYYNEQLGSSEVEDMSAADMDSRTAERRSIQARGCCLSARAPASTPSRPVSVVWARPAVHSLVLHTSILEVFNITVCIAACRKGEGEGRGKR